MKNHSVCKLHVVTGPTSGIGEKIALALAETRDEILLVGRNPQKLAELDHRISARGARCSHQVCDLSNLDAVAQTAIQIREYAGTRTIASVTNNAGLQERGPNSVTGGVNLTF